MNLTELLVTGFEGEQAVLAISLTPERAATLMVSAETGRITSAETAVGRSAPTFRSACRLVEEVTSITQAAS